MSPPLHDLILSHAGPLAIVVGFSALCVLVSDIGQAERSTAVLVTGELGYVTVSFHVG